MKPLHFAELPDRVCIVIGRRRWVELENIKKVEEFSKKRVMLIRKGNEEGLLIALYNSKRQFLGIGVLQEIDFTRKYLKISTPVADDIAIVNIGKVKLDKNLKEVSVLTDENHVDFAEFKKLF
jgi:polynucleotide 5'-kinase involved in rRNA processing